VLAYADPSGRVAVAAVDEYRTLWRTPRPVGPRQLAWSADGRRLLVVGPRRLLLFSRGGRLVRRVAAPGISAAAWAPAGRRFAAVAAAPPTGSRLVLYSGRRARLLFSAPGRLGPPTWAPDGLRVLVAWPQAGQWLFLRVAGPIPAVEATASIARQFSPGADHPPFPDAVSWCC
jgi:hypothetical protein